MPLSFFIGKVQNAVGLSGNAFQLRLTSAIAGTALAGVVYAVTKILFGRTSALYACILVALFPCLVEYSQEYRMYSYFALLAMLATYLFLKAYEESNVLCGHFFVACALLTMYNHFLGLIPIFSLYVYGTALLTQGNRIWKNGVAEEGPDGFYRVAPIGLEAVPWTTSRRFSRIWKTHGRETRNGMSCMRYW